MVGVVTCSFYLLSKYSEHISRTMEANEIFFFSASFFSWLYNSDGILIFRALSFKVAPPIYATILLQLLYCVNQEALRAFNKIVTKTLQKITL